MHELNYPPIIPFVIILAPLFLFLLIMYMTRRTLRKQNVIMVDLLKETEVEIKILDTAKLSDTNETTNANSKYSTSRLILFLSGLTALILGVCFTCFYFFINMYAAKEAASINYSAFTNTILALGIGVVPYAVNQIKKVKL